MKYILILLATISFAFAQKAKIDSVAIQAKIAELEFRKEQIVEVANLEIGHINYTLFVLSEMLKPKEKKE